MLPYYFRPFLVCCAFYCFTLNNLWAQIGALPHISLSSPADGQQFRDGDYIELHAETATYDPAYLLISSQQKGWVKFKWGYDSHNLWSSPQNVVVGGNHTLEIVLKDIGGNADWSKIRLHPQGNANQPLSLAPYIATAQDMGNGWRKISLPLADFYAGINFAALSYFEFPYSADAGTFQIAVRDIAFTGGKQPFVWWSEQKCDNLYEGGTAMNAQHIARKTYSKGISKVVFRADGHHLGIDYTFPFGLLWVNPTTGAHQIQATAYHTNGTQAASNDLSLQIHAPTTANNGHLSFPFQLSCLVLSRYYGIFDALQRATLAYLPYHDKQSRWELRSVKYLSRPHQANNDMTSQETREIAR